MLVVLTGASGCVGRALVGELTRGGHEIVALSRRASDRAPGSGNVRTVDTDLTGALPLDRLPANADAVMHVAQSRCHREFPERAAEVFEINTAATHRLVEYARRANAKSFILTSTGSVCVAQHEPVAEDAPTSPASFYPASKLAAEVLLLPYAEVLPIAVLRLFYVFGPGQSKMLIDGLADRIRRGVAVRVHGTEGIRIAPTFSGDVARVIRKAAEERWKGTYNVGSPAFVSLKTLANQIGSVVGKPATFEQLDGQVPPTPLPKLDKLSALYDLAQFTPLREALVQTFGTTAT